jgi:hypothetical protein
MFFPVGLPLGFDLLRIVLCHLLYTSGWFCQTKDERRKTKDFVSRSISSRQQSLFKFSGVNLAKTGRKVPFLL